MYIMIVLFLSIPVSCVGISHISYVGLVVKFYLLFKSLSLDMWCGIGQN